jgi:predicted GIY-YIG superfamily endonuclease
MSPRKFQAGINDLATLYPAIAEQAKGWDPCAYSAKSHKKMLWECNSGHLWNASIANRTAHNTGCPFCSGRQAVPGVNDLQTKFPDIAAEAFGWNPSTVKYGSASSKRQWICPSGHLYWMTVNSRTQGRSCPVCAVSGYKTDKAAWLYLLSREKEQKLGITNVPKARFATHRRNGWQVIHVVGAMDGAIAISIETKIKQWLSRHSALIPGTHENWCKDFFDAASLYDLARLAGVDGIEWDQLTWGGPDGLTITLKGETPVANRPPITAAIDLTADTLNALKAAGPNERGNYSLDVAVWVNEKRSSDRAPGYTGTVKVKGQKDGPKSYASVWVNESIGGGDDLF